jgi:uncharacterized phage protein (TIGR02218 family)
MTYAPVEASQESGQPIELFRFQAPGASWEYTSHGERVTYQTRNYEPRAITRSEPQVSGQAEDAIITITLPESDPFVNPRYTRSVPAGQDSVTIYRRHSTDPDAETIVYWQGDISSVGFKDREATITCTPILGRLNRPVPRRSFSAICAHVLYDRGCKVLETDHRYDVTVTNIDGATIRVQAAGIGTLGAGHFVGGFLRDAAQTDFRMVLSQSIISGAELELALLLPFPGVGDGDELVLFAGCDHTFSTCGAKFSNARNFGGFPWVPTDNPFETGIGGGT